jgi:hypothetical protein
MTGSASLLSITGAETASEFRNGDRFWQQLTEVVTLSAVAVGATVLLQAHYGFNWGDEGLLWYQSQRTTLGQIPIRDFFSYDPGRYYWSALFFKLLHGNALFQQIAANAVFGAMGLGLLCAAMCRTLPRRWHIATLLVLGLMLGFPRHKIFEQALSLVAVAGINLILARPESLSRWFSFGLVTGLAAIIGRNSGLYFLVATVLAMALLEYRGQISLRRTSVRFGAGILIGYLPALTMLLFVPGFSSAFYRSILFAPSWQLKLPVPFPWHAHLNGLHGLDLLQARTVSFLCLAVPIAYGLAILRWIRCSSRNDARNLGCAAALAGIPYLHHAFSRADFFHIAQGILPFAVVIGAFATDSFAAGRRRLSVFVFVTASTLVLLAWLPYEPIVQFWRMKTTDAQSVEQVRIDGRQSYVEIRQATVLRTVETAFRNCGAVNGSFLQAPYYPGIYGYLNTRAPFWELYYVYPRDEAFQQKHIEALQRNKVSLVLLNREAAMDGLEQLKIENTNPTLVAYILSHYQRSETKLPDGFELYYSPELCHLGS